MYNEGMKTTTRRDFAELERRRFLACKKFEEGKPQAQVVRDCKVSRQSASRWHQAWKRGGRQALKAAGRAGRKPRLSSEQCRAITEVLVQGAKASGYPTDLWNLSRVAAVIEKVTGVKYHFRHVGRILHTMGWSRQRPAKRAKERDEAAVRHWHRNRWPSLKKKPAAPARGLFSKTKAGSRRSRRSGRPGHHAAKRR